MKRFLLWTGGILLALVVAVVLAFRFSPWPSVAIIAYAFSQGDKASEARLEQHVPAEVVSRVNLGYADGPDEVFDINWPDDGTSALPTIVWVHGGAFIAGSKAGVANYLKVLAGHGFTTIGVEYSTGYGTTYPRPVEQVNAALGHVVAHAGSLRVDPDRLVLAGDSAGAQIAAQVAMIVTDPAYARQIEIMPAIAPERLRGTILVSGAFDLTSIDLEGAYGWFVTSVLWAYTGIREFANDERVGLASIPEHVSAAFPPTFVSSGNGDLLASQGEALVARLEAVGVKVQPLFFPEGYDPPLPHEYQFNLDTEAGQVSLRAMLAFLATVM